MFEKQIWIMSCVLEDAVSFEPLGGVTSIFFDDKTHQVRNQKISLIEFEKNLLFLFFEKSNYCSTPKCQDRIMIVIIKGSNWKDQILKSTFWVQDMIGSFLRWDNLHSVRFQIKKL